MLKSSFSKQVGIECYHAYQSFAEGEVTPAQAHEIGVKLAEEIWGNRFQVVVSTHLNTDNIHNHFVINSVSFVDGKRFCNTKKDYALMRKTSDRLCEDYELSVLKNEKQDDRYNKYTTSGLYKEIMKDSIDYAVATAKDYNEFMQILQDLDYIVTDRNNTLSIRREPYKRNTRIERQFGSQYSKENIYKRILETQPQFPYSPEPYLLVNRTYKNYNDIREKCYQNKGSISYLIFQYEKLFGINRENVLKSNVERITPELIREIKKMDEYSKQAIFLVKNKINTDEQLLNFEKATYEKINPLKSERENLWRKLKKAKTDNDKKQIEDKIVAISEQITPLSEEIRLCGVIQRRMERIKKIEVHQKIEEEKERDKKEKKKREKTR